MHVLADPSTLAALWTRARAMFARARAAISEPQAIAARSALTRKTKRDIAGWLARLESIVRKLLLAIAAGLVHDARNGAARAPLRLHWRPTRSAAATSSKQAASAPRNVRRRSFDRAHPETWPARFSLSPSRDPQAVPQSHAPRIRALWGPPAAPAPSSSLAPKHAADPAFRFALRLEALRRVLADPIPQAQRLARVFGRLSRRYPEAAARFAIAPARPCLSDPSDPRLIIEAIAAAIPGAPALADTS